MEKCICDDCKHAHSYGVRIGDCAYGNDIFEFECDIEDWSDEDDIAIDNNICGHYESAKEANQ